MLSRNQMNHRALLEASSDDISVSKCFMWRFLKSSTSWGVSIGIKKRCKLIDQSLHPIVFFRCFISARKLWQNYGSYSMLFLSIYLPLWVSISDFILLSRLSFRLLQKDQTLTLSSFFIFIDQVRSSISFAISS